MKPVDKLLKQKQRARPKLYKSMGIYYSARNLAEARALIRQDYTRAEVIGESIEQITGKFTLIDAYTGKEFEIAAKNIGDYFPTPCRLPEA